ncbi:MAG: cytochrome c oxidase assembly protein [Chloroflexota bacterium]
MTPWQLATTTWVWEPTVLLGCLVLLGGYLAVVRPLTGRALVFAAGVLVLLLALLSPLDRLGDTYLFSAHMLQHLLLVLVVPPLVLLGLPSEAAARALQWPPARWVERMLARPLVAWVLGIGTLWAWHLPLFYEAALASPGLHVVQHLTFLVTSTVFWWPVVAPAAGRRLAPLVTVPYLITAGMANSILGVILTFAPPGLYPAYQHSAGAAEILRMVRWGWGLSYAADQQVGGLLMWVLGGPVYLLAGLGALARWWAEPEDDLVGNEWHAANVEPAHAPGARGTHA